MTEKETMIGSYRLTPVFMRGTSTTRRKIQNKQDAPL